VFLASAVEMTSFHGKIDKNQIRARCSGCYNQMILAKSGILPTGAVGCAHPRELERALLLPQSLV
jgi:hypothetical protein